jgi:hypothetical protein
MSENCDLNYVYQLLVVDYVWAQTIAKDGGIQAIEMYNALMEGIISRVTLYRKMVNMRSSQPAKVEEIQQ